MKIIAVLTYFDRQFQLQRTLKSIKTTHKDFEVIVVDDQSDCEAAAFSLDFPVKVIQTKDKCWTNPEPVLNTGIKQAIIDGADVIITQNCECYHVGDVIARSSLITDKDYFSFACLSIDKEATYNFHDPVPIASGSKGAICDGQTAWYNHSIHRPVYYDFCGAITTENMIKLNGFDERFSEGCGYGDDNYISRIRKLGLNLQIIDSPFVVHQWHYNGKGVPEDKCERVDRNRKLHLELLKDDKIKAVHIYTQNL
jgi:glycosyltransferase involved in cell wall biosynthesis